MRKAVSVVVMMALVFGAFAATPADAAKKKKKKKPARVERTVEAKYNCPCGVKIAGVGPGFITAGQEAGGAVIPTSSDDAFISLKIDDQSGQKVFARLSQGDTNGDGLSDIFGEVCGETSEPIPMPGGSEVQIFIYEGNCGMEPTPSIAFGGTITATFSNMP